MTRRAEGMLLRLALLLARRRLSRGRSPHAVVRRALWWVAPRLARRWLTHSQPSRSAILLGAFFVGAGANHFALPRHYRRIVPPGFGDPATVVVASGVGEIAGGVGVLVPSTRRLAGLWLIALLAAVFPANIHMAVNADEFQKLRVPRWALWLRLPLQPLMMWWTWRATQPSRRSR